MRLNLGCGDDIREGYVNVDFRKTHSSVLEVDLSKFPWPFDSESVDEILMLDFLEHFPWASTPFILLECNRVLKKTGTVVIQVPDGTHLMKALAQDGDYLCNKCGRLIYDEERSSCEGCGQSYDDCSEAAMRRLYGGQDYVGNFHQCCFTYTSLQRKARECGLELVEWEEEKHQYANWNLRGRFKVGDVW